MQALKISLIPKKIQMAHEKIHTLIYMWLCLQWMRERKGKNIGTERENSGGKSTFGKLKD